MKALIALDRFADGNPVLDLFARIGFADCRVTLTHVLQSMTPAVEMVGAAHVPVGSTSTAALAKSIEREATHMLEKAREQLYAQGIHSDYKLLNGGASDELIHEADRLDADLVGAASSSRGAIRTAILGSVCRALTIGSHKSVLLAKKQQQLDRPFTAVLATDHSRYCDEAIKMLLKWNPMGIQRLTILTAAPPIEHSFMAGWPEVPEFFDPLPEIEEFWSRSTKLVKEFSRLNIEAKAQVVQEPIVEAINHTMEAEQADLLIMAAQGHGFIERLGIGSVSLHEAVAEPHSLLILRNQP